MNQNVQQNGSGWIPVRLLRQRFTANAVALATRYPREAEQLLSLKTKHTYFIRTEANRIHLGIGDPIKEVPLSVSPEVAESMLGKMFPSGKCDDSVLVAGEALGWLWKALYGLPCFKANAPGYRPPLHLLMRDIERLWVILHVQDWQQLLADHRVRLFLGDDAVEQFEQSLHQDSLCPWPSMAATVDPSIWPAEVSLATIISRAREREAQELSQLQERHGLQSNWCDSAELAQKLKHGEPLRIMGLTSRYTTFLQYSMRDWLAGMQRLGHDTRLLIEEQDHQNSREIVVARACDEYRPDLIVAIDHCRATMTGVLDHIPVVMWVQDRLSKIFDGETGSSQGKLDYVIGYARQELTQRFAYPKSKFMPAMVGVNDERFEPRSLSRAELDRYRCEVSFVSHASTPAEKFIVDEMSKQTRPEARAVLDDLYQQLLAVYQAGEFISTGDVLERMIDQTLLRRGMKANRGQLMDLFAHRVNNAMFRHQAVKWAVESGADVRLYGNGWENHPEFCRYARGPACNQDELNIIYQASAINLQVTPFGAVHQRLLDGLAAGGFFLLRAVTADEHEVLRKKIWRWCGTRDISSGKEMLRQCDDELTKLLFRFQAMAVVDPQADIDYFYAGLEEAAMDHFQRTANTMWIESPQVTFSSREQLCGQIAHFLTSPDKRRHLAALMRQRVLETHTYKAISQRMLNFIENDMALASAQPRNILVAA